MQDRQEWTILHEAVNRNAPLSFVKKLITHGLNPNEKNAIDRTPLHYAVQGSISKDLLSLLLDVGGNPNQPDKVRFKYV